MIHYSQEDLVVIEFTDQGPSTKSEDLALAEDFESFLVQRPPWGYTNKPKNTLNGHCDLTRFFCQTFVENQISFPVE